MQIVADSNSILLVGNKETAMKYKHFQESTISRDLNTDHSTDHKDRYHRVSKV